MSIWFRLGEFVTRISSSTRSGVTDVIEAMRTFFAGDPELRRKVAFSVAM
ncbi:molecular chaperone DjiA, partial [Rhizobiaceae sp. 2RAB30]